MPTAVGDSFGDRIRLRRLGAKSAWQGARRMRPWEFAARTWTDACRRMLAASDAAADGVPR
ncbi:hypothetical protein [Burkholderia pseudomallei]|uniref:hypothetical protein n=1 Tax=Burkholderia pseudomallei TaxID=28450 RepID=UPI0005B3B96D|nr:hypothetical protein [Burkholderia pseudomallei]ONB59723.1 hypothetical protein AQ902_28710 [Burkholderia pseudomallei]ONB83239.1 hypothetical protein AQ906_21515 [Burkholderia pseudomallei]ONB98970.1 hypothetical protein AQ909_12400 [Burkholderia pseudomallei]